MGHLLENLSNTDEFSVMKLWNFANQTLQWRNDDRFGFVCLTFANRDSILVSASSGPDVRTWSVKSGAPLQTFAVGIGHGIKSIIGSPYHPLFVAGGTLYDTQDGSELDLKGQVATAAFTPDGNSLIVGSEFGGPATWDLQFLLGAWGRRLRSGRSSLADLILPATAMKPLDDSQSQAGTSSLPDDSNPDGFLLQQGVDSLAVSSDGLLAASGSRQDEDVMVWDLSAGRPVMKIRSDGDSNPRLQVRAFRSCLHRTMEADIS